LHLALWYKNNMNILLCLILLLLANGIPIILRNLPGERYWNWPVDGDRCLPDGQRLFGSHKTWRGIVSAILITALAAWLLHYPLLLGMQFGAYVMLGDLLGSFIKRRLRIAPGGMAPGLDQIPEALLPLLLLRDELDLNWAEILVIPLLFVVISLLLSRLLYRLRIRRKPY